MKENEAVIIDVRSSGEFAGGHVQGSINIPINSIPQKMNEILAIKEPIILCCASGARSFSAYQYLRQNGCANIQDGGPWQSVARLMSA